MAIKHKEKVVTGIFAHQADASRAIQALEERGFGDEEISLLMSDTVGEEFKLEDSSKLPEGVAAGAASGGIIGALIAGLTTVGTIATGGGLLVAGPVVAALAGGGAGAGIGGLIGGLAGYGVSEYEAKLFAREIEDGKILVAVHCDNDNRKKTAERVLGDSGAEVSSRTA